MTHVKAEFPVCDVFMLRRVTHDLLAALRPGAELVVGLGKPDAACRLLQKFVDSRPTETLRPQFRVEPHGRGGVKIRRVR